MPDDIIARAEAALEGVTDGPWVAEYSGEQGNCVIPHDAQSTREAVCTTHLYYQVADAEFIAAARTLVPALAAELEAARAEVERLRARCEPQVYVTTPPCSEYGEGTRGEVRHPIGRCGDPNCGGDW